MKKLHTLMIALFAIASVQMFGMKRELKNPNENPSLTQPQANLLWNYIEESNELKKDALKKLNNAQTSSDKASFRSFIQRQEKRIDNAHEILFDPYGNSYTDQEIADSLQ